MPHAQAPSYAVIAVCSWLELLSCIGKLHMKIPWMRLKSESVKIHLQDIFLIVTNSDGGDVSDIQKRVSCQNKCYFHCLSRNILCPQTDYLAFAWWIHQLRRQSKNAKRQGIMNAENFLAHQESNTDVNQTKVTAWWAMPCLQWSMFDKWCAVSRLVCMYVCFVKRLCPFAYV